jgi:hypothetical protein
MEFVLGDNESPLSRDYVSAVVMMLLWEWINGSGKGKGQVYVADKPLLV